MADEILKKIYDISNDEMKTATQEDFDNIQRRLRVTGKLVRVMRHIKPDLVPQPSSSFSVQLEESLDRYMKDEGIRA